MRYEPLEEDWGMGAGDDLEKLEIADSARRKFLMDGKMDKMTSSNSRQTTIRVWTLEETMCRRILENLVEGTVRKSTFMTSLQEDLEIAWVSRQEPLCEEMANQEKPGPEGRKEEVPDIPEGSKPGVDEEKETIPEGWKGDEPEEVRRDRTTGCTYHQTSRR